SKLPDGQAATSSGTEPTSTRPVDETTQASYYVSALQLSFCQPNVIGLFLFHAFDEPNLANWQSGVYYADGAPKSSLPAVQGAASQVRRGVVTRCDGMQLTPRLKYLFWPRGKPLLQRRVQVVLTCDIDCGYSATIGRQLVSGTATGRVRTTIAFPRLVPKGTYRIRLTLMAPVNPGPPLVLSSGPIRVGLTL